MTPEEDAAPVLAVTRTIGGAVLVLVGALLILAGVVLYFVVPWFGWARDDIWGTLAEWADIGGALVGGVGIILFVIGGALVQRARKRRFELFVEPPSTSGDGQA